MRPRACRFRRRVCTTTAASSVDQRRRARVHHARRGAGAVRTGSVASGGRVNSSPKAVPISAASGTPGAARRARSLCHQEVFGVGCGIGGLLARKRMDPCREVSGVTLRVGGWIRTPAAPQFTRSSAAGRAMSRRWHRPPACAAGTHRASPHSPSPCCTTDAPPHAHRADLADRRRGGGERAVARARRCGCDARRPGAAGARSPGATGARRGTRHAGGAGVAARFRPCRLQGLTLPRRAPPARRARAPCRCDRAGSVRRPNRPRRTATGASTAPPAP